MIGQYIDNGILEYKELGSVTSKVLRLYSRFNSDYCSMDSIDKALMYIYDKILEQKEEDYFIWAENDSHVIRKLNDIIRISRRSLASKHPYLDCTVSFKKKTSDVNNKRKYDDICKKKENYIIGWRDLWLDTQLNNYCNMLVEKANKSDAKSFEDELLKMESSIPWVRSVDDEFFYDRDRVYNQLYKLLKCRIEYNITESTLRHDDREILIDLGNRLPWEKGSRLDSEKHRNSFYGRMFDSIMCSNRNVQVPSCDRDDISFGIRVYECEKKYLSGEITMEVCVESVKGHVNEVAREMKNILMDLAVILPESYGFVSLISNLYEGTINDEKGFFYREKTSEDGVVGKAYDKDNDRLLWYSTWCEYNYIDGLEWATIVPNHIFKRVIWNQKAGCSDNYIIRDLDKATMIESLQEIESFKKKDFEPLYNIMYNCLCPGLSVQYIDCLKPFGEDVYIPEGQFEIIGDKVLFMRGEFSDLICERF